MEGAWSWPPTSWMVMAQTLLVSSLRPTKSARRLSACARWLSKQQFCAWHSMLIIAARTSGSGSTTATISNLSSTSSTPARMRRPVLSACCGGV
eukprot:820159-Pyramimonas_sp.AAC.1